MKIRRSAAWHAFGFAIIVLAMALPVFCELTCLLLFDPGSAQRIQEPPQSGSPMPSAMAWNPAVRAFVIRLGSVPPGPALALEVALALVLAYLIVRLLNPTFRMTAGVDWSARLLTATYMFTPPVIKALLITASASMPLLLACYGLVSWLSYGAGPAASCALLGAAAWYLFSHCGVAGDFDSGNYNLPREASTVRDLLGRGAIAGFLAWLIVHAGAAFEPRRLFDCWRAMGGIGERQWWTIVALSLGPMVLLAAAAGGLADALAPERIAARTRMRLAAPWLAIVALAMVVGMAALPAVLARRLDFPVAADREAGALRAAAHLTGAIGPANVTLLSIGGEGVLQVTADAPTATGIAGTPENTRRIRAFLARRAYRTALIQPALRTLADAACLNLDPTALLDLAVDTLGRAPDPSQVALALEQISWCAPSPAALRAAHRFADTGITRFPDRVAQARMADLFTRLGDERAAQVWLETAGVPQSRREEAMAAARIFRSGEVTCRITVEGHPLAGARAGLLPAQVGRSLRLATEQTGEINPYFLHAVAAGSSTDARGTLHFTGLPAGEYVLLVALPTGHPRLWAAALPADLHIAASRPRIDLGTVALSAHPVDASP